MTEECDTNQMHIKIARLEERIRGSELATELAARHLEAWKQSSNEWRAALSDQRAQFVTRTEVISMMVAGLMLLGIILKYWK